MSQQINLFNPIFRQQKKYFSAVTMAQALGMVLLGAVLLTAYASYRSSKLAAEALAVNKQLLATRAQLDQANAAFPPRQKNKALEEQIRKAEGEVASLQKVAGKLKQEDFGNTSGYAEYMRAFARQIVDGVWLTGFSLQGAGTGIGLQGRALQPELVPAYINRLKQERVLQGISFSTLQMQVPPPAPASSGGDKAESRAATVPYVEFSLQSTDESTQPVRVGELGAR